MISFFLSSNLIPHLNCKCFENKGYHVVDTLYIVLIKLSLYRKTVIVNGMCFKLCSLPKICSTPSYFFKFFNFLLHWVFIDAQAFSSCGKRGLFFVAVRGPLTGVVSIVAEHRL